METNKNTNKSATQNSQLQLLTDFRITYYSIKEKKLISRFGIWGEKSRIYISKSGKKCFCYYQLGDGEAKTGYRTATDSWDIELVTKFGRIDLIVI